MELTGHRTVPKKIGPIIRHRAHLGGLLNHDEWQAT
jgi:hypothetical protein